MKWDKINKKQPAPLVSVVIASYNHDSYVEKSINSALKQTYKNIELIVIDDGSKDKSVEIIKKMASEEKFKLYTQDNIGLTGTLNRSLSLINGEYFVPFGSDDIMCEERVEKQVDFLERNKDIAICGGNITKINEKGEVLEKQKKNKAAILDFEDIFLDKKPGLPAPTLMFRAKNVRDVGGYDPSIKLEDLYMQLKISKVGHKLGYLEDSLAYYRVHQKNTYKNFEFMYKNVMDTYKLFSDHKEYKKVVNRYKNSIFLKSSKIDKEFAKNILKEIPLGAYRFKTIRGIISLIKN